jgi:hypothetical protein
MSCLYMRFSLVRFCLIHQTNCGFFSLYFLVSLPSALFWAVFQLQLPRIRSSEDKGFLPRTPKRHRGTPGTGTDPRGTSKLALAEGQLYHMVLGGGTRWQDLFSTDIESRVSPRKTTIQIIEWGNYTDIITETNSHQPVLPVGQVGGGRPEDSESYLDLGLSINTHIFKGKGNWEPWRYCSPEGHWVSLKLPTCFFIY